MQDGQVGSYAELSILHRYRSDGSPDRSPPGRIRILPVGCYVMLQVQVQDGQLPILLPRMGQNPAGKEEHMESEGESDCPALHECVAHPPLRPPKPPQHHHQRAHTLGTPSCDPVPAPLLFSHGLAHMVLTTLCTAGID